MKRDVNAECLTEHDARQLAIFELELGLFVRLTREGHSRRCAELLVFELGSACTCGRDGGGA